MGFQLWLGPCPACCPDPDPEHRLDNDGGYPRQDDEAITGHGYDSRTTPVDTLMAGPVSMGLRHAHNMEYGDYA